MRRKKVWVGDKVLEKSLSIVILRHPFSRLASAYYNKFVESIPKGWYKVASYSQDSLLL